MTVSFIRAVILYIAVMAAVRIMGKRQIGELQPSELVITIILGDLASVPMQNTGIPLLNGIVPIITLVVLEVGISVLSMKSKRVRRILSGRPSVIIRDGEVDYRELKYLRFSADDLMEELRGKDIVNIDDVQLAIVDTNGEVCIVPKAGKRPLTPDDIGLAPPEEELWYTLVSDGKIISANLKKIGKSEKWLQGEVKKQNSDIKNILIAAATKSGTLTIKEK